MNREINGTQHAVNTCSREPMMLYRVRTAERAVGERGIFWNALIAPRGEGSFRGRGSKRLGHHSTARQSSVGIGRGSGVQKRVRERSYGLLGASEGKSFAVHKACEYELFEDFGVSWFGG